MDKFEQLMEEMANTEANLEKCNDDLNTILKALNIMDSDLQKISGKLDSIDSKLDKKSKSNKAKEKSNGGVIFY